MSLRDKALKAYQGKSNSKATNLQERVTELIRDKFGKNALQGSEIRGIGYALWIDGRLFRRVGNRLEMEHAGRWKTIDSLVDMGEYYR